MKFNISEFSCKKERKTKRWTIVWSHRSRYHHCLTSFNLPQTQTTNTNTNTNTNNKHKHKHKQQTRKHFLLTSFFLSLFLLQVKADFTFTSFSSLCSCIRLFILLLHFKSNLMWIKPWHIITTGWLNNLELFSFNLMSTKYYTDTHVWHAYYEFL